MIPTFQCGIMGMMNTSFTVKTTFDLNSAKIVNRVSFPVMNHLMALLCGLDALLFALNLFVLHTDDWLFWAVIGCVIVGLMLINQLLIPRMIYKNYNRNVGEVTYDFREDAMTLSCALERGEVQYPALVKLVETRDYYLLYPQKRAAYVLPKSGFVQGEAGAFRAFIEGKTGLKTKIYKF